MAGTDDSTTATASDAGPDWTRVLVVVLCLASILLAAMLVPSLGGMDSLGPDAAEGATDEQSGSEGSAIDGVGSDLAQAAQPDLEFDPEQGLGDFGGGDPEDGAPTSGDGDSQTPSAVGSSLQEEQQVGGPISQERYQDAGSAVVFVADADEFVYWRQGSYDRYTGGGWERTGSYESFTPLSGPDATERTVRQELELRTSVRDVPGGWQIADVEADSDVAFQRGSDGAVRAEEPLETGTTVSIESHQSTATADRLRAAGTAYDPAIRQRYATYPQAASPDVAAFTDDLTADDETPYDQAKTIEQWIKQEKTYDLNATHDFDEPMVEQFVFDMERVYCAYAASAMTVMLRSQNVPARYVVGYSPGVAVDGTQVVTQQNAHAWVEVYFPGEGWIRFDPTPPSDRQSAMQDELQSETDALQSAAEEFEDGSGDGSGDSEGDDSADGETADSDESEGSESGDSEDDGDGNGDGGGGDGDGVHFSEGEETDDGPPQPPYEITTEDPPVPGTAIEVAVTKDGAPVPGVTVAFEGERVGETDSSGMVTGTVPYVAELTISVVPPDEDETTDEDATAEDRFDGIGAGLSLSGAGGAGRLAAPIATTQQDDNVSLSTLPTEGGLEIRADDVALPGGSLELLVHVAEHAVPNASVRLDGERVAITDERGLATVGLPTEVGTYEIAAERGELSTERSVAVRPLSVSVDAVLPLPGRDVTVAVEHAGAPVPDAAVAVDGEQAATETPNGTATVSLPVASEADVRAESGAATAETTVSGLYRNAALLAIAVLGVVGGGAALAIRKSGVGRSDVGRALSRLASLARATGRSAIELLGWLVRRPVEVAVELGRLLADGARRLGAWCRVLPWRLGRWLRDTATLVAARGFGVLALLDPRRLLRWLVGLVRGAGARVAGSSDGSAASGFGDTGGVPAEPSEQQVTLRTLWQEFLDAVRPARRRTRTPGEIERYALSRGFPREPVQTIVQAFREAEYGRRQPTGERVDRVRSAVTTVQSDSADAAASDGAGSSQSGSDESGTDHADVDDSPDSGGDG